MIPDVLGLRAALIGAPIILSALAGLYGWGYLKGFSTAKDRSAIVWQRSLDAANREADRREQEALDAAEAVVPTPATDAELVGLCNRAGSACRDRKG